MRWLVFLSRYKDVRCLPFHEELHRWCFQNPDILLFLPVQAATRDAAIARGLIRLTDLLDGADDSPAAEPGGDLNLERLERQTILTALREAGWIQKRAAARLGISARKLHSRIDKLGINAPGDRWRKRR